MEQALLDGIMTYGAMGVCLAYFIYKDLTANKEMRETIKENTKAYSEFTSVLHIFTDRITRGDLHE